MIQEDNNGVDHPVCNFFKKVKQTAEKLLDTIEKECLALSLAIQHFEVYLSSAPFPTKIKDSYGGV